MGEPMPVVGKDEGKMMRRYASRERKGACIPMHVLLLVLLVAFGPAGLLAQRPRVRPNTRPMPPPVRTEPAPSPNRPQPVPQNVPQMRPGPQEGSPLRQQPGHLGDWFRNHQSLSPEQKERALRQEPGFNRLPPDAQQRVLKQFRELNSLPPDQRARKLGYLEAIEKLSPAQRQQLQGSMSEMRSLPGDRQRAMRKALRDLRDIPPNQRQSVLESPRFDNLSPQEKSILGNLIKVEP